MKGTKAAKSKNDGAGKKESKGAEQKDLYRFGGSTDDDDFEMLDKRTTRHGGRQGWDRTSTPVPSTSKGQGRIQGHSKVRDKQLFDAQSLQKIDQKLKDAGLYEEKMDLKEKVNLVTVLNLSLHDHEEHQEIEKALNENHKHETGASNTSDAEPDILEVDYIASPQQSKSKHPRKGGKKSRQNENISSEAEGAKQKGKKTRRAVIEDETSDAESVPEDENEKLLNKHDENKIAPEKNVKKQPQKTLTNSENEDEKRKPVSEQTGGSVKKEKRSRSKVRRLDSKVETHSRDVNVPNSKDAIDVDESDEASKVLIKHKTKRKVDDADVIKNVDNDDESAKSSHGGKKKKNSKKNRKDKKARDIEFSSDSEDENTQNQKEKRKATKSPVEHSEKQQNALMHKEEGNDSGSEGAKSSVEQDGSEMRTEETTTLRKKRSHKHKHESDAPNMDLHQKVAEDNLSTTELRLKSKKLAWSRSRLSRVGEDKDYSSSPETGALTGSESRAVHVDVQVHSRPKSLEEPILNEEDLMDVSDKCHKTKGVKAHSNKTGQKATQQHGNKSSSQQENSQSTREKFAHTPRSRPAVHRSVVSGNQRKKHNKLALRDMLAEDSEEEDDDSDITRKQQPSGKNKVAGGLNLDHSSGSEGDGFSSPVFGEGSQVKRRNSVVVPESQPDISFGAGDTIVPDSQEPPEGGSETIDSGAHDNDGKDNPYADFLSDGDDRLNVKETPTHKRPEAESQPLFSPSPIRVSSPRDVSPVRGNIENSTKRRSSADRQRDHLENTPKGRHGANPIVATKLETRRAEDNSTRKNNGNLSREGENSAKSTVVTTGGRHGAGKHSTNSTVVIPTRGKSNVVVATKLGIESIVETDDDEEETQDMNAEPGDSPGISRASTGHFEPTLSGEFGIGAMDNDKEETRPSSGRKRTWSELKDKDCEPPAKKPWNPVIDVFDGHGVAPSPTWRVGNSPPAKPLVNKVRLKQRLMDPRPFFCPRGKDPAAYVWTLVAYWDQYRVLVREIQRNVIDKVPWGAPVVVGPRVEGTLDYREPEPKYSLRCHGRFETGKAQPSSTVNSSYTLPQSMEDDDSGDFVLDLKTTGVATVTGGDGKNTGSDSMNERATRTRAQYQQMIRDNIEDPVDPVDKRKVKNDDEDWKPKLRVKGAGAGGSGTGRGRGTRHKRGGHLGVLSHRRIGAKSAQQSITDHFGFDVNSPDANADTQSTQAYDFDDNADDFFAFEKQKNTWSKTAGKNGGKSAASSVAVAPGDRGDGVRRPVAIEIDVDEDSREAVELLQELGQRSRSTTPVEKSRSVTPVGKSRSVTPDSQGTSKNSAASTTDPSRPVSRTSVVSSRYGTSRSTTLLPNVDLRMGNTLAQDDDDETTSDTLYSEIDRRNTNISKRAKNRLRHRGKVIAQGDSESDRVSPVSDISEYSTSGRGYDAQSGRGSRNKRTDGGRAKIEDQHKAGPSAIDPESQPMGTMESQGSGPNSEQDVFASSGHFKGNYGKGEKESKLDVAKPEKTYGRQKVKKTHSMFGFSDSDENGEGDISLATRLQTRRVRDVQERSKQDGGDREDPELTEALKLSKQEYSRKAKQRSGIRTSSDDEVQAAITMSKGPVRNTRSAQAAIQETEEEQLAAVLSLSEQTAKSVQKSEEEQELAAALNLSKTVALVQSTEEEQLAAVLRMSVEETARRKSGENVRELEVALEMSRSNSAKSARNRAEEEGSSADEELATALSQSRKDAAKSKRALKSFVTDDSDSDTKENSEAEKVLREETDKYAHEQGYESSADREVVPRTRVKKLGKRVVQEAGEKHDGTSGRTGGDVTEVKDTRSGRRRKGQGGDEGEGHMEKKKTKVGDCPSCGELFEDIDALQAHAADCYGPPTDDQPKPGTSDKLHPTRSRGKATGAFNQQNIRAAITRGVQRTGETLQRIGQMLQRTGQNAPPDFIDSDSAGSTSDDYDPTKDRNNRDTTDDDYDEEQDDRQGRRKVKGEGHTKGQGRSKGHGKRTVTPSGVQKRNKRQRSPDAVTPRNRKAPKVDLDAPLPAAATTTTPPTRRPLRSENDPTGDPGVDLANLTPSDRRRIRAENRSQLGTVVGAGDAGDFPLVELARMTACPICGREFHEDLIDQHVNACLDSGPQGTAVGATDQTERVGTRGRNRRDR